MKKNLILCASLALLTFAACKQTPKEDYGWLKKGIDAAIHNGRDRGFRQVTTFYLDRI